jgi:two-component system, OmpR family, response regulator ChvI
MGMLITTEAASLKDGTIPLARESSIERGPGPLGQGIELIVVEEDDFYRKAVEAELNAEDFVVHSFKDGSSMLTAVGDGLRADAVILDWRLKDMSGIDLLKQMKGRGLDWPVVFLTNQDSPTHEKRALESGAADFVNKARDISILIVRLRRVLTKGRISPNVPSDDTLVYGRLTLRTSRAYWDGIDVGLTMAEFKTVSLLVSNAGLFVTYRQVYDCMRHVGFVAGNGEHGYRVNVRSGVRRTREKFKVLYPDFDEIQTYTSFGYRWKQN